MAQNEQETSKLVSFVKLFRDPLPKLEFEKDWAKLLYVLIGIVFSVTNSVILATVVLNIVGKFP